MWAIKERREEMGMTQAELAEKVGVHQTAVAKWESGDATPTVLNLMKLSEVLDCSMERLAGKDG